MATSPTPVPPDPVPICRRAISILVTLQEGIQLWDDAGCLVYANPASRSQFPTAEVLAPGRHWTALARDCRTVTDVLDFDRGKVQNHGTQHKALDDAIFQTKCQVTALGELHMLRNPL